VKNTVKKNLRCSVRPKTEGGDEPSEMANVMYGVPDMMAEESRTGVLELYLEAGKERVDLDGRCPRLVWDLKDEENKEEGPAMKGNVSMTRRP